MHWTFAEVPRTVEEIANDEEDEIHKRFDHEERLLAFQFLVGVTAKIINFEGASRNFKRAGQTLFQSKPVSLQQLIW